MGTKQKYAIIVAGGSGKRMGTEIPKQFIDVQGLPILMHTINCFVNFDAELKIIVVLPESQHEYWAALLKKYKFNIDHKLAKGGAERFHSVLNGLQYISKNSLVAIHDGVRPLVSKETIKNCFEAAEKHGTSIPVIPATESIRKITEETNIALDRSKYFMVQTPQVFQADIILKAYEQRFSQTFTDDASVVEKAGYEIKTTEGNSENIKITRPMDLKIAEVLIQPVL